MSLIIPSAIMEQIAAASETRVHALWVSLWYDGELAYLARQPATGVWDGGAITLCLSSALEWPDIPSHVFGLAVYLTIDTSQPLTIIPLEASPGANIRIEP